MKWGIRKAGRSISKTGRSVGRKVGTTTKNLWNSGKRARSWNKKYLKRGDLSDAELKKVVERLRMENEFKRLQYDATSTQRAIVKRTIKEARKMPVRR